MDQTVGRNGGAPGGAGSRRLLLSTALATAGETRLALVIAVVAFVAFLAVVPLARVPLARMPAFIPGYQAALFFIDLITAVLLYDQFVRVQTRGILFLAAGYLFDAFIIVAHTLSFPGAFAPTGLLGGNDQTTAWLYVFWHGGFPLFVMCYVIWDRGVIDKDRSPWTPRQVIWGIIGSIVGVAVLTLAFVLIATVGHDLLPIVMQGGDYSLLVTKGISPTVWGLTFIAMLLLWRREQRVMDLWLMLVMWIWLLDIALSAVVGSSRFDLGFYVGRLFGLIAASFLVLALIVETIKLYSSALSEAASAEQKVAELKRAYASAEISPSKKGGGEPVEAYVQKQNIAYYQTLLKSMSLGEDQRRTVEKLLSEEKGKLGRLPPASD
ncbi:MASE4 domain-containing protein [Bradyrhizobium sp. CCBAU 11386]|uniref:MASE4 domain-containing protein n=1 Tax=Bradyrhizobium sp. CCBAU 11386 TaxID=1630837 RepID=UPI00230335CA|nr:MASE4 domain-containing protein [Bradyrhizobium sp. CCBAU 11386]